MTNHDALTILAPFVTKTYERIALRPHIYSGRSECIEAYVAAIEDMMDYLSDSPSREESYSNFPAEGQFGEETFHIKFERENSVCVGFIDVTDEPTITNSRKVEAQFTSEFSAHWTEFIKWRKQKLEKELMSNRDFVVEWLNDHQTEIGVSPIRWEKSDIHAETFSAWYETDTHFIDICCWNNGCCLDIMVVNKKTEKDDFVAAGECDGQIGLANRLSKFIKWLQET